MGQGVSRNGTGKQKMSVAITQSEMTAQGAEEAKRLLEEAGYVVEVFAADGAGGREMEARIAEGRVTGVLDLTLIELSDEMLHGIAGGGPNRLEAAPATGTPTVVVPGCLDMARFGSGDALPPQYRRRHLYPLAAERVAMRTEVGDCARLGRLLAEKINRSTGPVAICLPLHGLSLLDAPGKPFWATEANMTLFGNLTTHLRRDIPFYEGRFNINDPGFAVLCVETLRKLLDQPGH